MYGTDTERVEEIRELLSPSHEESIESHSLSKDEIRARDIAAWFKEVADRFDHRSERLAIQIGKDVQWVRKLRTGQLIPSADDIELISHRLGYGYTIRPLQLAGYLDRGPINKDLSRFLARCLDRIPDGPKRVIFEERMRQEALCIAELLIQDSPMQ